MLKYILENSEFDTFEVVRREATSEAAISMISTSEDKQDKQIESVSK